MRKLSEVCRITGLTPRALRGYAEVGLLQPTAKEGTGEYWYYDDQALEKLFLIQMFVEVGYTRRQIKEILDSKKFDFAAVLKKATAMLEEKKQKLENMIQYSRILKLLADLPKSRQEKFVDSFISPWFDSLSDSSSFKSLLENLQYMLGTADIDQDVLFKFFEDYIALIALSDKDPGDPEVLDHAESIYMNLMQVNFDDGTGKPIDMETVVDLASPELAEVFSSFIFDVYRDLDSEGVHTIPFKPKVLDFVSAALKNAVLRIAERRDAEK
ncbi:MAG: MerR family transcriptional regulator [Oscillospiraceae bacterium]|nr:MerR family transcriptional regulator [Oscillospiraceae bacterium]